MGVPRCRTRIVPRGSTARRKPSHPAAASCCPAVLRCRLPFCEPYARPVFPALASFPLAPPRSPAAPTGASRIRPRAGVRSRLGLDCSDPHRGDSTVCALVRLYCLGASSENEDFCRVPFASTVTDHTAPRRLENHAQLPPPATRRTRDLDSQRRDRLDCPCPFTAC